MNPMTSKRCKPFALLAALVAVAGTTLAEPPGRHPRGPAARLERSLGQLGLDDEQTTRVQAILDRARENRHAKRAELHAAFEQMHSLLDADTPDVTAIMHQADEIGSLQTEQHKAMLRTLLAVRAELTAEQRAQLRKMKPSKGPPPWRRGPPGTPCPDN